MNYGSIYADVHVVEDVERPEQQSAEAQRSGVMYNPEESLRGATASIGMFQSFQDKDVAGHGGQSSHTLSMVEVRREPSDFLDPAWAPKEPKSRSGVLGSQKSGAKSVHPQQQVSAAASDRKGRGGAHRAAPNTSRDAPSYHSSSTGLAPADRPMFRKKASQNIGDAASLEALYANEVLNEKRNLQRKLSKEARARERKVMLEERKRKIEMVDKQAKASAKSARGPTAMSAQSLQQLTGYSVQVKARPKRQKAYLKESMPSESDERMQRQALADQKRRLMKELQEREALQKQQPANKPSTAAKQAASKDA